MGKILDALQHSGEVFNKRNAILTILGLAVILGYYAYHNNKNLENSFMADKDLPAQDLGLDIITPESTVMGTNSGPVPDIVYQSGRDGQGIFSATIFGSPVKCVSINYPYSAFDPNRLDPNYDPSLPVVTLGSEAMDLLGVEQSAVSISNPIILVRGVNFIEVESMDDHALNMLSNNVDFCN